MGDTSSRVKESSYWDGEPFQLPLLSFRGKLRRVLTDLICFAGMTVEKTGRVVGAERKTIVPRKILVVRRAAWEMR